MQSNTDTSWRFDWLLRPGSDSSTRPLNHASIIDALRSRLPRVETAARGRRSDSGAAPADDALSEDVRLLGSLLGWVLAEHAGIEFYRSIEALRQIARSARREPGGPHWSELDAIISKALSPLSAEESLAWLADAAGAFHLFLALCNIAEGYHYQGQERTLDTALAHLARITPTPEALDSVTSSDVRLVATAHPTKIMRQRILLHQQDIYMLLKELRANQQMTALHQIEVLQSLAEKIEVLWATQFSRWERPQVSDEIDHTLNFFTRTIYDALAAFHQRLEHNYWFRTGRQLPEPHQPRLTLGSWVGGDMDGNPFVTPEVFAEAITKQHRSVVRKYAEELRGIAPRFSHALYRAPLLPELRQSIDSDIEEMRQVNVAIRAPERVRNREPYRLKLRMMAERLSRRVENFSLAPDAEPTPFSYGSVEALIDDLEITTRSLEAAGYHRSVAQDLAGLRRKIDIYGFHAASLDLREDSEVIRLTAAGLFASGAVDWSKLSPAQRLETLTDRILSKTEAAPIAEGDLPEGHRDNPSVLRLLKMLTIAKRAQEVLGERSVRNLIITMTSTPEDILSSLLLLRDRGLFKSRTAASWESSFDVVPLFETINDLQRAPEVMDALFRNPAYSAQIDARDRSQLIMLGFSDSSKDGGYFASNWAVYRAQAALLEVAEKHHVKVRFFYGRGGSIGRGGGPTTRAVMALPPGSSRHGHDLTEQGEVLARHYAITDIAEQHFESTVAALWTKRLTHTARPETPWVAAAERIADLSRQAYTALIHDNPDFIAYFEQVTPKEVELVKIGSRPQRRRMAVSVRDLRAIPWVFRWFQSRQILPGWLGFGSGIENFLADGSPEQRLEQLREMYARWPFFRSILSNSEIALRQTDLDIARYYVQELAMPLPPAERLFKSIEAEYDRTCRALQRITGHGLLQRPEDRPLDRSIDLKEPYLDPLNYIQVRLLSDYRRRVAASSGDEVLELYERAIISSIEGIATGLGTTG